MHILEVNYQLQLLHGYINSYVLQHTRRKTSGETISLLDCFMKAHHASELLSGSPGQVTGFPGEVIRMAFTTPRNSLSSSAFLRKKWVTTPSPITMRKSPWVRFRSRATGSGIRSTHPRRHDRISRSIIMAGRSICVIITSTRKSLSHSRRIRRRLGYPALAR